MTLGEVKLNAISGIILAALQLGAILFGKTIMASAIAQIRMAWNSFEDQELVAMCDTQYNSMLETWDKYKSDRED